MQTLLLLLQVPLLYYNLQSKTRMKGISKEDKNNFITKLATILSTQDGRTSFLALQSYNDVKKYVRKVDPECGKLVDNGQHFLDIMTRALAQVAWKNDYDDDADNLRIKWEGLQAEHRARKR